MKRSEEKRGELFGGKKKMKQTVEIGKISYMGKRWNFPRAFFLESSGERKSTKPHLMREKV